MSIIYVLIPIAVLLTAIGLYLFFWAVKTEQFDDLEKQGLSILFDDEKENSSDESITKSNSSDLQTAEQASVNNTTSSQSPDKQSKDN
ncbi:cbb3-type cytochrome oxidase assembly protein CcoS [Pseudocolwellia sp. HL-MZ19]|uniref:cbb3-type cytochrome oxidase assembly protein CcoS n=1 Tax=Pseudocolwellia sp. HL-MZ19 TaxID=3400846 RepID=UPI003CF280ED